MQEPEIFRGSNRTRRRWNHSLNCAPNSTSLVSKLPTRHLGSHSRITASREDHRHQHCLTNISHNKRLLQYPFQYRQPSHIHACTNPVPKQRASDQIPQSAKFHQTQKTKTSQPSPYAPNALTPASKSTTSSTLAALPPHTTLPRPSTAHAPACCHLLRSQQRQP